MVERGEHLRLAFEAREAIRIEGERCGQHLERDIASEFRIARAIYFAHPAGAEGGRISYGPTRVPADKDMW